MKFRHSSETTLYYGYRRNYRSDFRKLGKLFCPGGRERGNIPYNGNKRPFTVHYLWQAVSGLFAQSVLAENLQTFAHRQSERSP